MSKVRVNEPLVRWRLRDLKSRGLEPSSAGQLARAVRISEPYLSQLLKGHRSPDLLTVNRIAFALGIDPELLLAQECAA